MRRLLYILLGGIIVSCSLFTSFGKSSDGGDVEKALERLRQEADSGNPSACFRLARMLESGNQWVAPDSSRALELYTQAADSAYPPALNYLGFLRFNGMLGIHPDPQAGLLLIEKAAMLGDLSAAANLGWLLSQNVGTVKNDTDKALYWLEKASESGSYVPVEAMADIYMQRGDSAGVDRTLERAAMLGSQQAVYKLFERRKTHYDEMPTQELTDEAFRYYHSAASRLGVLLMDEVVERQDASPSERAHIKAVKAQLMSLGLILPYDYDASMRLFYEAACEGDPSAQYIVGETIDLTPDAFRELEKESVSSREIEKESVSSREVEKESVVRTADEWRREASRKGILDSRAALSRLLP